MKLLILFIIWDLYEDVSILGSSFHQTRTVILGYSRPESQWEAKTLSKCKLIPPDRNLLSLEKQKSIKNSEALPARRRDKKSTENYPSLCEPGPSRSSERTPSHGLVLRIPTHERERVVTKTLSECMRLGSPCELPDLVREGATSAVEISPRQNNDEILPKVLPHSLESGPSQAPQSKAACKTVSPASSGDGSSRPKDQHKSRLRQRVACEICKGIFSHKYNLNKHKMRVHRMDCRNLYACEVCGKHFNENSYLNIHVLSHSSETPFSCKLCGKSFKRRVYLQAHMSHSNERPLACKLCDKSYKTRNGLSRHERVHAGIKPYSCELCGKSFTDRITLRSHMLVHTNDRPVTCLHCGKRFKYRRNCNNHHKTHIDEKLSSCKLCVRSSRITDGHGKQLKSQSSSLPEHVLDLVTAEQQKSSDQLMEIESENPSRFSFAEPKEILMGFDEDSAALTERSRIELEQFEKCLLIEHSNDFDEPNQDTPTKQQPPSQPTESELRSANNEKFPEVGTEKIAFDTPPNPETFCAVTERVLDADGESSDDQLIKIRQQIDRTIEETSLTNLEMRQTDTETHRGDWFSCPEIANFQEEIDHLYEEIVVKGCNDEESMFECEADVV